MKSHGDHIGTLLPTNKRHKQLIREHGSLWRILRGPEPMQCFSGEMGYHIESMCGEQARNVKVSDMSNLISMI